MSLKELWVNVLKRLMPTIKKADFLTWFQNTMATQKVEGVLTVGVPNVYAENWIKGKYDIKVLQAAKELDPEIIAINYEVKGSLMDRNNIEISGIDIKSLYNQFGDQNADKKVRRVNRSNEVLVSKGSNSGMISSQMLNNRYTLVNFVIGKENRLPHAAAMAVSNMPGGIYNPLYIYAGVGLGKTHLLQAIGNEVLANFPDKVVKYLTAEKFVTEVVEAIGKRYMHKFKDQYRNVDVFLIDDIQFFARKDSSQQEFFHTFNELYDRNKQIVLTSDCPPSELDGLDERLKSRFGMGMVVEILFPDFETRLAILQQKCCDLRTIIDPEVLSFIANNVNTSVRELEGVLKQVVAEGQLSNRMPTIKSVAEVIKRLNKAQNIIGFDLETRTAQIARTLEDVVKIVADYYKISVDALTGKDRHKELMIPRQVCMYLIKHELGESYERIGICFSGREHSTVMHACGKMSQRLRKDLRLVRDVNSIKREMGL